MSALASVFDPAGRDHRDPVMRMLEAASHRAPGGSRVWVGERVALGRRGRSDDASPPLVHPTTQHAIVFDGRIDNTDELSAALGLGPHVHDDELVLAAYERWGESAPARLLGDFAFAVWDASARQLFCARDVFGQRPLFYAAARGIVAIGSEPQQLLAHPLVPARINEGVVAEHLAGMPVSVGETVWSDVARLPPAHTLIASDGGVRVSRYWQFDPDADLACSSEGEYVEAFTDVFRTAVRCRVRGASRGVGVFLSGGLDSSAVAAAAERLHREEMSPEVRAYSLTYPGRPCDESPYIDAVVDRWSLPSMRLRAAAPPRARIEEEVARYRDLPAYPNGSSLDPLRASAAADLDVVLTGYGGDEWFTGSPLSAADLIREGRVVAAARQMWDDGTRRGGGRARGVLLRQVAAPLVPETLKPLARAIAGAAPPAVDWIAPAFAARVGLHERLRRSARSPYRTAVQREVDAITSSALQVIGDELEERAAAFAGIEQRQPFTDRRVAAFGFALPDAQRRRGDETKVILRRAFAADLPEIVRGRRDKAEFSDIFVDAIEQLGGRRFFEQLRTADAGWVDPAAALAHHDRLRALYRDRDGAYIAIAGALWAIAAVELWFRHTQGASS